jgi:hypothetical protein
MSPDERMERLAEEVRTELSRIEAVVGELSEGAKLLTPDCPSMTRMGMAGHLHSFYTGCEVILARIARAAGRIPKGERWHKAILFESAAAIEGVRPAVLKARTATVLDALLDFRHFFRNAYGVKLDVAKLERHSAAVPEAWTLFRADVEGFLRLIESAGGNPG